MSGIAELLFKDGGQLLLKEGIEGLLLSKRAVREIFVNPFDGFKLVDGILFMVFIALAIQPLLQKMFPLCSYLDEAAVLGLGLMAMGHRENWIKIPHFGMSVILLTLFISIGLLGNILSGVAKSPIPVLIDLFTCIKYPLIVMFGLRALISRNRLVECLVWVSKISILVMVPTFLISQFVDLGMTGDVRMGIASFNFIFPHQTFLFWYLATVLLLFLSTEQSLFWICLNLFLMTTTLRTKALGFVVIAILLTMANKKGKKSLIAAMLIGSILAAVSSMGQFAYYFNSDGFARTEMTRVCVEVANEYFPVGSGFGTFGSNITSNREYYSVLYEKYGLSDVWGLTPEDASFVSDTFWPTVIGQFGWIGLIAYACMLAAINIILFKSGRNNNHMLIALLSLVFLIISSTSESAFFNPSVVMFAMGEVLSLTHLPTLSGVDIKQRHSGER